ncbi:MAG TPA: glycosyltransferase [Aquabacterium sp.]|nr:glycosyltransferase [Aquabacterium sp.]
MIAYHYPPVAGSSGIQRTLKFSAYLRDHGWEPIVLTVDPRAYDRVSDGQMADIPAGLQVERAFALDTSRHLAWRGRYLRPMSIPDRWVSWWPAGVWRGWQLIRQHRPQAMFSTFPIATAHMIGLSLQRLTDVPWIADFRDNMTDSEFPRDPITWRFNRWLEGAVVRRCTRALFTTSGALDMYAQRYPDLPASRWSIIENGFDEDNFTDAERDLRRQPLGLPGQLTLVHSGVLYPEERDPRPFFAALAKLKCEGMVSAGTLRVVLRATGSDAHYRPMLEHSGIADLVELAPPVSYRQALQEMLCADGLLLFQAAMCNHQIPAKLYEYLRASRPVFALTDPAGNTAHALRSAGCHDIVDLASEASIEQGLRTWLRDLRAGRASRVSPQQAAMHSRRARTAELASLLANVAATR